MPTKRGWEFDVGVFDIELPDGNGVELASELIEEGTVDRAVFFSGVEHEAVVREAMKWARSSTNVRASKC